MANIDPAPSWANIRRLETTDRNMAGPGGILNDPTTSIAARLNLLRDNDTTLGNSVAAVNSRQDATDSAIANIQGQVLNAPGTLSDLENGAVLDPAAGFPDVPSVENALGPVAAINESIESLAARSKQLREDINALSLSSGANGLGVKVATVARTLVAKLTDAPTVLDAGARAEEGFDSTVAFQYAADTWGIVLIPFTTVPFEIDRVVTTRPTSFVALHGVANIKLRTPTAVGAPAITLNHDGCFVDGGILFDGNLTRRTCVRQNGSNGIVHIRAKNVNYVAGDNETTSALLVEGSRNLLSVQALNFVQDITGNDSVPRAITLQGSGSGNHVEFAKGDSIGCCLLNAQQSTFLGDLDVNNGGDNGVYNFGSITIGTVKYHGSEEALVNSTGGWLSCGKLSTRGVCFAAIGVQDAAYTNIDSIHLSNDGSSDRVGTIARTRIGNTRSGYVRIGSISGRANCNNPFNFNVGAVEKLVINNVNADSVWLSTLGSSSQVINLSAVEEFHFSAWNLFIVYGDGSAATGRQWNANLPTTSLKRRSTWDRAYLFTRDLDGKDGLAAARWFDASNGLISVRGARWTTNVGPYIERGNGVVTGAPDVLLAVPAVGTWGASGDFSLNGAIAAPFRVRCTQSGTFGSLSVTATTTANSNIVVFSDVNSLRPGQYVTIAGAGADRNLVTSISGFNVIFSNSFPNAVSGAAATNPSPVFVSY